MRVEELAARDRRDVGVLWLNAARN